MTSSNIERIAEIRARVAADRDQIQKSARLEGNKLVLGIEFKDEKQLIEKWLQCVADCKSLLCIMDGGKPI